LLVVASFYAEHAHPTVVIKLTIGSGDLASGENQTLAFSRGASGVTGCHYLCEGIIYSFLVV
jgi:hypothetical protein